MLDIIVIALIVLLVFGIGFYLYRAKRRGSHCIGCPHSRACQGGCCSSSDKTREK